MGGVIKKIASIAKPFISMIPVVGPMIAKGIEIATTCMERLRQARMACKGQGLAVLDEEMSKMRAAGDKKKKEAEMNLAKEVDAPVPRPAVSTGAFFMKSNDHNA